MSKTSLFKKERRIVVLRIKKIEVRSLILGNNACGGGSNACNN